MNFRSLQEKCNYYRNMYDYKLLPNTYVLAMVDGHSFSRKAKPRFKKPFDADFVNMMDETAKYICEQIQGVKCAFVQSDEISFILKDFDTPETDAPFKYRLCKLQSIIASMAAAKFNQMMTKKLLDTPCSRDDLKQIFDNAPIYDFDCKVWNVPNANDAQAWFLYRQIDCIRNSKEQAAQTYISHKDLLNKTSDEQIVMLKDKCGIDWNEYPEGNKYGRYVYKCPIEITTPTGDTVTRNKFQIVPGKDITNIDDRIELFKSINI